MYVAVPAKKGTVLALLDAHGQPARGWPLRLPGRCALKANPTDGSVRILCGKLAYALDDAGRLMPGWPVEFPGGAALAAVRVADGTLYGVVGGTSKQLVAISSDGTLRYGVPFDDVSTAAISIAPNGTAYAVDLICDPDSCDESEIVAVTMEGPLDGWPVRVQGWASTPAFDARGNVYVVADTGGGTVADHTSQAFAFGPNGRRLAGWPVRLPFDALTGSPEGVNPPDHPYAASDGSVRIVVPGIAYALDPSGARAEGWPYRLKGVLATDVAGVGTCPSGCGYLCGVPPIRSWPLLDSDASLYVATNASGDVYAGGNRITAVDADADVKAGWPVTLAEKGAWFETFAVGDGGVVFGYALEPAGAERNKDFGTCTVFAGTIAALDEHGDPIYTTTLVAP